MIKLSYRIELYDKDGGLLWSDERESRSLLLNFAKALYGCFKAAGGESLDTSGLQMSASIVDQDGATKTIATLWYASTAVAGGGGVVMAMGAPSGDDSYGIIVGSGSTPVSYSDYRLASKIPHGSSAGQLNYGTHSVSISAGSTSSFVEVSRAFTNVSGSTVVVREVGIVAWNYWTSYVGVAYNVKFLVARDVLPSPVSVPNLASLLVRYRFSLSL